MLLLIVYVALDLSNPFMPGAFRFNPDESVEVCLSEAQRVTSQPGAASAAGPPRGGVRDRARLARTVTPDVFAVSQWLADLRQPHAPERDSPPPGEDH
jgi:hypothetical protein